MVLRVPTDWKAARRCLIGVLVAALLAGGMTAATAAEAAPPPPYQTAVMTDLPLGYWRWWLMSLGGFGAFALVVSGAIVIRAKRWRKANVTGSH